MALQAKTRQLAFHHAFMPVKGYVFTSPFTPIMEEKLLAEG